MFHTADRLELQSIYRETKENMYVFVNFTFDGVVNKQLNLERFGCGKLNFVVSFLIYAICLDRHFKKIQI